LKLLGVVIRQSDMGVKCWSFDRLFFRDCRRCERYKQCRYSCKGVYPEHTKEETNNEK